MVRVLLAVLLVLVTRVVCLRTAYTALGALGLVLGCLLVGTFVGLLSDVHLRMHRAGRCRCGSA